MHKGIRPQEEQPRAWHLRDTDSLLADVDVALGLKAHVLGRIPLRHDSCHDLSQSRSPVGTKSVSIGRSFSFRAIEARAGMLGQHLLRSYGGHAPRALTR